MCREMKKPLSLVCAFKLLLLSLIMAMFALKSASASMYAYTEPVAQDYNMEEIIVLGRESEAREQNGKLVQEMDSSLFQTLPFLQPQKYGN